MKFLHQKLTLLLTMFVVMLLSSNFLHAQNLLTTNYATDGTTTSWYNVAANCKLDTLPGIGVTDVNSTRYVSVAGREGQAFGTRNDGVQGLFSSSGGQWSTAVTAGRYFEFRLSPSNATGKLNVTGLSFTSYYNSTTGTVYHAVVYSTDGVNWVATDPAILSTININTISTALLANSNASTFSVSSVSGLNADIEYGKFLYVRYIPLRTSGTTTSQAVITNISVTGTVQAATPPTAFANGNLALVRLGTGVASPSGAVPGFIDEYTTSGTLVRSIQLPVNSVTGVKRIAFSSLSANEGLPTVSPNGQFMTLMGYDAALGATGLSTSGVDTARVIAVVNSNGTINTSNSVHSFAGAGVRGAITNNGTDFWMIGSGGGVKYVSSSDLATVVDVALTPAAPRMISIFNNQLYITAANTTPTTRLGTVGTGLPTTAGQNVDALPGIPTGSGSPYSFVLFDTNFDGQPDLLYLADDAAGLLKYSFDGATWTARGVVAITGFTNNQLRSLTAKPIVGGFELYGTTTSNVLKFVDNTAPTANITATPTSIITVPANYVFRGVVFAPGSTVMPVAFSSFAGVLRNGKVALSWSTATEVNNDRFNIQRSANGKDFETIGTVKGNGNSTVTSQYNYIDDGYNGGIAYYKLQQIDKDGKASYSKVVAINSNTKDGFKVVVKGSNELTVIANATKSAQAELQLFDMLGRKLFTHSIQLQEGVNSIGVTTSATMPSGTYNAVLITKDGAANYKFYKP